MSMNPPDLTPTPPVSEPPSDVRIPQDKAVVLREDFKPDAAAAKEMFAKTLSLLHELKAAAKR